MKKKETTELSDRKSFGIRLKPELVKKLKILAVQQDVPVNRLLETAILEYLKTQGVK